MNAVTPARSGSGKTYVASMPVARVLRKACRTVVVATRPLTAASISTASSGSAPASSPSRPATAGGAAGALVVVTV